MLSHHENTSYPCLHADLSRWQYKQMFERRYFAHWTTAQSVIGNGLLVSRSMFEDHLPDKQLRSLRSCPVISADEAPRSESSCNS